MATPNPLKDDSSKSSSFCSKKTFPIAGILTDIFGLGRIVRRHVDQYHVSGFSTKTFQTKKIMAPVAASCINDGITCISSPE